MAKARDLGILVALLASQAAAQEPIVLARTPAEEARAVSRFSKVHDSSKRETLYALVEALDPKHAEELNNAGKAQEAVAYLQPTMQEILKLYAVEELRTVLSEKQRDKLAFGFNEFGSAFLDQEKNDFARVQYLRGVILNSNNVSLQSNLGITYQKASKHSEAISHFSKALELDSENGIAHYQIAVSYFKVGDLGSSLSHFRKSRDLNYRVGNCDGNISALQTLIARRQ